ncbi:amidohydrolase family protein, partial [Streptomyces sp.]|uniref:amidohydrolase family protein n=1 Tax=Streptomyces sp. TaxID=1931 RepID=UPI0028112724
MDIALRAGEGEAMTPEPVAGSEPDAHDAALTSGGASGAEPPGGTELSRTGPPGRVEPPGPTAPPGPAVPPEGEALAVRALLRRLELPGLVDVHTHFMPRNVLDKVWAYFDAVGPLTGVAWPITYRAEEDRRLALLRGFGALAFTAMLYPHKPGMAAWLNGWAAGFAARTPDCLHTATFFPEPGVERYVREALDAGARVFKVHLQVGGFDPNDPLLDAVWGELVERRTPVVVHCGSGP